MNKKATAKKTADLVSKMDSEAEQLLSADKNELSLETRVAIFAQVAKWVQIRNRIGDGEENAGLLDAYRTTLDAAQGEVAEREASRFKTINDPKRFLGRKQRAAKGGTADNGGAELDALKSRLPPADVSSSDGDRGGGGGEISVDAGDVRVIRPELPGNAGAEFDEGYSSDEF